MQHSNSSSSFGRLMRQLLYIPCLHNRWLTKETKAKLSAHIAQAEQGHLGEIMLIIENNLPVNTAYRQNCTARAVDLFGTHKVWDTELNTGVLIYVNLCEKELEIITDRGICQKELPQTWQALCDKTLARFKAGEFVGGLTALIDEVGIILKTHYPSQDPSGNELSDNVVYLK